MAIKQRSDQIIFAIVFLTRLPLGALLPLHVIPLSASAWAFPLAGILIGAISGLPLLLPGPGLLCGALSVTLAVWLTVGLHEDALADFCDGIGAATREDRLRIMRDPRIGSFGALALILTLLLRAASLAVLGPWALIAAVTGGRAAMVLGMAILPPARDDGLGRSAKGVSRAQIWVAGVIAALACIPAGITVLGAIIAGLLFAALIIRLARQRLGGQTGDVLGTISVVTETAMLVAFAILK